MAVRVSAQEQEVFGAFLPPGNECHDDVDCRSVALLLVCVLTASGTWVPNGTSTSAHSNVSSILADMLNGYDSRLRPEFGGEYCTCVSDADCLCLRFQHPLLFGQR